MITKDFNTIYISLKIAGISFTLYLKNGVNVFKFGTNVIEVSDTMCKFNNKRMSAKDIVKKIKKM